MLSRIDVLRPSGLLQSLLLPDGNKSISFARGVELLVYTDADHQRHITWNPDQLQVVHGRTSRRTTLVCWGDGPTRTAMFIADEHVPVFIDNLVPPQRSRPRRFTEARICLDEQWLSTDPWPPQHIRFLST